MQGMQGDIQVDTRASPEDGYEPRGPLRGAAQWLFGTQEGILFLCVIGIVLLLSLTSPVFLTRRNIGVLLSQISMTAITAFGMTALVIAGEVDLSVGSMQAFIGVLTMQVLNRTSSLPLGIAAGLGMGAVVGLVNAAATIGLRISSFVVTLAMLSILRGAAYISTNAAVQNAHKLPEFKAVGNGFLGPVPWPVVIMIAIIILFYLVLNRTTLGRYIYATGGNPRAAVLAGVRVKWIKALCFVATSVLAALSAIILISRMNSGQNNAGVGFEMQVVGAVLLGGTSLAGGQGSIVGTLLAVLLLGTLNNGIVLLGINSSWQMAVNGLLILLAVWLDARRRKALGEG
jgi:ribose transport system permease protein